jgi:GGDEF domain-containing protein
MWHGFPSFDTDPQPRLVSEPLASPSPISMDRPKILLYFSPTGLPFPHPVKEFAVANGYALQVLEETAGVLVRVSRSYPEALIIDAREESEKALGLCRVMKAEEFTSVVPVILYISANAGKAAADALEAGADEVLTGEMTDRESQLRIALALRRAERDVSVHPTTRLPGAIQIERDIGRRLGRGEKFAVCYADLDHFKEFNDRYGYRGGDRVILILSRILRDIVRGRTQGGFVGHIGGDDFIFTVPLDVMPLCCEEILETFEALIPLQYSEDDRRAGHFPGEDRRGNIYQVPLMALSIGVVTNRRRRLVHPAQVSELVTEMKNYAKTIPGSVFAVDRRLARKLLSVPD